MKIIFMGTPAFAAEFLQHLLKTEHEISAVVTQPDKPAGRGKTLTPPPVKVLAESVGLDVLQPTDLASPDFEETLKKYEADLFVVVAFSILPKNILGASKYGAINIHGSLLPKYRGAAPVQRAIENGDKETGVTIFLLDEKMDHGPIIERRKVEITPEDTYTTLLDKMVEPASDALDHALKALEQEKPVFLEQLHEEATPAKKIKKEEGLLDFSKAASEIHNKIRAFTPWPGGFSTLQGKKVYLRKTTLPEISMSLKPGEIRFENKRMLVGTAKGILEVLNIQVEGKKEMPVASFIQGLHHKEGLFFCS